MEYVTVVIMLLYIYYIVLVRCFRTVVKTTMNIEHYSLRPILIIADKADSANKFKLRTCCRLIRHAPLFLSTVLIFFIVSIVVMFDVFHQGIITLSDILCIWVCFSAFTNNCDVICMHLHFQI